MKSKRYTPSSISDLHERQHSHYFFIICRYIQSYAKSLRLCTSLELCICNPIPARVERRISISSCVFLFEFLFEMDFLAISAIPISADGYLFRVLELRFTFVPLLCRSIFMTLIFFLNLTCLPFFGATRGVRV